MTSNFKKVIGTATLGLAMLIGVGSASRPKRSIHSIRSSILIRTIAIDGIGIVTGMVIRIAIRIGGEAEAIGVADAVGINTQTGAVHSNSGRLR